MEVPQPATFSSSHTTTSSPYTSHRIEAPTQNSTPIHSATFSCAHTTTDLPHIGVLIEDIARDGTPIRAYAHPCKTCHRSYCVAAQEVIEAFYMPKIIGYDMRVERMTKLIERGEGGEDMVRARMKRYLQGEEVWEQIVWMDFWLWKPYYERWGDLGFTKELGEGWEFW